MHLIIKITSNALETLVAAKENCFHEPFKTIETVRIAKGFRILLGLLQVFWQALLSDIEQKNFKVQWRNYFPIVL